MIGERFGRWVVLGPCASDRGNRTRYYVHCRCDCGSESDVYLSALRRGKTLACTHCGHRNQHFRKHGGSETRAFRVWSGMKSRVLNKSNREYRNYGGRNIKVCERWLNDFAAFLEDMGEPPSGMSLDRIDVNGDYEPKNCRWADAKTQGRNRRNNHIVEYRGRRGCLADFVNGGRSRYCCVLKRIRRGWSVEDAIETESLR